MIPGLHTIAQSVERLSQCCSVAGAVRAVAAVLVVVLMTNSLGLTIARANGLLDDRPRHDEEGTKSGPKAGVFKKGMNRVRDVAWSPDGKRIAIATAAYVIDGKVQPGLKVFDASTGAEVPLVPDKESSWVNCVTFSPDSRRLAFGNMDEIDIRDIATRKRALLLEASPVVFCLAYSPDGKRIASGTGMYPKQPRVETAVKIWDSATGKERLRLDGHMDSIWTVAFSPDGKLLASGSSDGTARLWDAITGKQILTLKSDNTLDQVAFSPNGKLLAAAGGRMLGRPRDARIWDVQTGKELFVLKGHRESISALAFSPDGKLLATGSWDGMVSLWYTASGLEKHTFRKVAGGVRKLVFGPDGTKLMAANAARPTEDNLEPGEVLIWDLTNLKK
jgi:WD40 repeat protein